MRLIDADALMRDYAKFVRRSNNSDFDDIPTWNDAVSLLGSTPTIDAVPVVRCRECKYWDTDWEPKGFDTDRPIHFCGINDIFPSGDWFCADGERKYGDEDG